MEKIALIIGGSSGIGLATAEKLLAKGYIVYNGSRNVCPLKEVKSLSVDASETESIKNAVEKVIEEQSRIDLLIYCAGYSMASPIEYVSVADFRYLFEVNFFGAVEAVKTVVPHMRKAGGGKIIFISSIGAKVPIPFDPYYCSSKAALDMLGITLRTELIKYNIYLSSVLPGGTATPFSLKRNINNGHEPYKEDMQKAVDTLYNIEQKGMTAEAVAETIYRVAKRKNPPPIVAPGPQNKLFLLSERLMPRKLFLWIIGIVFSMKNP